VSLFVFIIAFMGAGLLFPSYFLQIRGESTLHAGLLMAPQGIGAMVTMPIAGMLADKVPVGRTVPFAMALIAAGFFTFTQVGTDTSYLLLCGSLFVMGLGMGGTMMPIMTSALQTLKDHEIARGSTLMNITQQVAASIGTALFSVVLTNGFNDSDAASKVRSATEAGQPVDPSIVPTALSDMSGAFGSAFLVGTILVAVCIIPALMLPRKKAAKPVDPTVLVGH
jgi:MFS family permease